MGKGGGGGHTPVEAKESGRSKQRVKIVEVISEGEVEGLAEGMKSVYFDNTPVQNEDESYNFQNVLLEGRVGSQSQEIISGFNTSEKEVSVGAQIRKVTPITRTITDAKVSRLRLTLGVQSLFRQEDNGDTNGATVNLTIFIGNKRYPIAISGKYSSQYLQQHTFTDLPKTPFTVRVERETEDSKSQRLQNNTVWSSYTEIIDTEFTYPNTAYVGVKFDSEYFSNLPTRTYDIKGIKLKVPSNYNPETREYKGLWDGTFKIAWSDNPAWVLYDIVTNKRYSLGERVGEMAIDKWTLYQVAQYCDQLVPDGFGGTEPRFTCNAWLTEQRAAYDVINDICSIFRAMPVWNGRELTVVMDRPADPVWTYTNANVENGEFTYTFSAKKSRHNAIQVEYADKNNAYEKTIEYVSDDDSIRKNGLNVKKVTAFGCTSRGQAHRTGLWLLQTEKLETKTVSFTVGTEGLMHTPGDIIKVADVDYAGTNIGGRVLKVEGKKVTLDREINPEHYTANSFFTYINKQAKHQDIRIVALNGAEITLERTPEDLTDYSVWSLTTQKINTQLFRALSVKEEAKGKYSIVALQHEPQKEAIVDNGAKFEPKSTALLPRVSDIHIDIGTDGKIRVDATVSGGEGTVLYDIRLYKNGKLVEIKLGQKSPEIAFDELEDGNYSVVIQAKNERGQLLSEQAKTFTIDRPPVPRDVRVLGGLGNISISWAWVDDFTQTEIWVSEQDNLTTAQGLTKLNAKMYSHEVGAKQVRYYWLRHVRGQNVGAFYQQAGVRGESSVDIDKELKLLNEKLSQNIINEVFDTALPARKLDLTLTVADIGNVAQYRGYKQVYNEKDGKLYTWNGKKYDSTPTEILASAIKGTIGVDQLAPIPTTKLTGQLNQNQIPNISADKIQGALSLAQVPAIPTTKLTGTIGAYQLQANSIGANLIQANAIGTTHLQSNSVGAQQMQANSIGANAIQANAIGVDKLQANSVTAAKIQTGAIRANHVAAGELTTDKLAIGLGGNLLTNPIFANPTNGVPYGWALSEVGLTNSQKGERRCFQDPDYGLKKGGYLPNENVVRFHNRRTNNSSTRTGIYQNVPVIANNWYIASAYMGNQNCTKVEIYIDVRGRNGEWLLHKTVGVPRNKTFVGINDAERAFIKFQVPPNGVSVDIFFFFYDADGSNANGCWMFVARPMLEECTEYTREPSPWQNAGVTAIHGGSIVTNSITAQQIAARTITGNEIVGGTIEGKHIAGKTITANHIVSKSITSKELNVESLSAISSNIGHVTAGTITGTRIEGNTIEGGTIRGARLEGVTGKFTGELEVTQLIGGGVIEQVVGKLSFSHLYYDTIYVPGYIAGRYGSNPTEKVPQTVSRYAFKKTVTISSSKMARYVTVIGANVNVPSFTLPAGQSKSFEVNATFNSKEEGVKNSDFMVLAYALTETKTIRIN